MAETFYTPAPGEFVADFIARHRRMAPWKRHSVAILILSEEWDRVALCLPRKVLTREGEDRIRVPIQGRLTGRDINPVDDARIMLWEKAKLMAHARTLNYLGFGFTRSFRAEESEVPYSKLLHVVHYTVPNDRALPPSTDYAARLDWFHLDALPGIAECSMDERKAWLFFAALKSVAANHTPYAPRLRRAIGMK